MEWWLVLLLIFGGLSALLLAGMPIAFAFTTVNVVGVYVLWGGYVGLNQLIYSVNTSVASFALLPVPMFILMGEIMFHSGLGFQMMDALDKWIGKIPGRLGLLAVGGGTLFATLTGVAMGSVAMLGSILVPEMEERGYRKPMSLGPILGSGGLAIMIPPSALAVILATLAQFSIGRLLVAIFIPGCLLALAYAVYIIGRCALQPSIAPPYDVPVSSLLEKVVVTIRHILPLGSIIFLVIGLIILGVASPTEAAATGAVGTFLLALIYGKLTWAIVKKSVVSTTAITVMILMILTGSVAFSQIIAYTGATRALTELAMSLPVSPMILLVMMQVVLLILGMLIDQISMMMIVVPIFMPIVEASGWDPVWWGAIVCLNIEMATTSPPFGVCLFVMKSIAPPDTTMGDIYRAVIPFLICDLIIMGLMMAFPQISLWLPGLMR